MKDSMRVGETHEVSMGRNAQAGDEIRVRGRVEITLCDKDGNVKDHEVTHNLMTTLGKQYLADLASATQNFSSAPTGIKLGQGTTAPAAGDSDVETVLTADPADAFQAFDSGFPKDDHAGHVDETTFQASWAAGEATFAAITEAVIKSAFGSTDAISRITFAAKNKGASDTLTIRVFWSYTAA